MSNRSVVVVAAVMTSVALPAAAQVVYSPFEAPTPYGYPVPGGVLQPNEVLGTSPSYEILPNAYGYGPATRVIARCQYPDGWNVTDFNRDVNGIPNGVDHACPVAVYRAHNGRARY